MKANKTKTNFTDLIYQHLRFASFHYFVYVYGAEICLTLLHFPFAETIRLVAEYFVLEYYHQDSIWQTSSRQFIFILFVS